MCAGKLHVPRELSIRPLLGQEGELPIIGREIIYRSSTTSTNDEIEKLARDSAPEGVVVFAEEQTRGRGRMGRVWSAPRGKDLLFSVLLRPPWPPTRLTVLAAVAVARAIEDVVAAVPSGKPMRLRTAAPTTLCPVIKWPNDVLLNGKKLAGILVETRGGILNAQARRPVPPAHYCILGVGLNVNSTVRDFPAELRRTATSLRIVTGKAWDREALATELLAQLNAQYLKAQSSFRAVAEEWAHRCATLGKFVAVSVGGRRIEGTAHRLDDDGALIVRTESGRQERIIVGDIVLEKQHE